MKILKKMKDGGPESHVTGFFLVEIKSLFSIVLLRFAKGTREAFHNHAFNAVTLWLCGSVMEEHTSGLMKMWMPGDIKYTSRNCFHRVDSMFGNSWALSFRGPWSKTWKEFLPKEGRIVTLSNGRKVVA
jgi:hypothetical protein